MTEISGKTILIVDDSFINRQLIIGFLIGYEINIIEAGNGQEALDILTNTLPDLILLDLIMPELDGFEFLEILRTKNIKIPIIVLTAYLKESTFQRCMDLGVNGYLNKPYRLNELLNLMNDIFKN
jgi:CheY-like chemotaxis protein